MNSIEDLRTFIDNRITWFGQSAFRIVSSSQDVLYIDMQRRLSEPVPADVILYTHPHHDHYNAKAALSLSKQKTEIIVPKTMAKQDMRVLNPGETIEILSFQIEGIPAYNLRNFPHGKHNAWLGYLIRVDGITIYHAGDTDFIPEMKDLQPDIAMLPVVGFVSMSIKKAVEAAKAMKARIVIPMHYGLMPGTGKNGEKFANVYKGEAKVLMQR